MKKNVFLVVLVLVVLVSGVAKAQSQQDSARQAIMRIDIIKDIENAETRVRAIEQELARPNFEPKIATFESERGRSPSPRPAMMAMPSMVNPAAPLPALAAPPIVTSGGVVQPPTPRPLPNFPVKRVAVEQPAKLSPTASQASTTPKAVPVAPGSAFQQAKAAPAPTPAKTGEIAAPAAEIKRQKTRDEKTPGVVSNVEINHIYVQLATPPRNVGKKIAIEKKGGEYILGVGTPRGWEFDSKTTKKVPPGYEIIRGQEVKS